MVGYANCLGHSRGAGGANYDSSLIGTVLKWLGSNNVKIEDRRLSSNFEVFFFVELTDKKFRLLSLPIDSQCQALHRLNQLL